MDARRAAAAVGMATLVPDAEAAEVAAALAKSQCVDIFSDDDAGADEKILSQEKEFMKETAPTGGEETPLFQEGMQQQGPSAACPVAPTTTVAA